MMILTLENYFYNYIQSEANSIMFHLQKSNNSSDDNKQINLLQDTQERISKVDFTRANALKKNKQSHADDNSLGVSLLNRVRFRKGSYDVHNPRKYDHYDRDPSVASENGDMQEKYSTLAVQPPIRASVSILTDASNNNKLVGIILFAILLVFTPLEAFALLYTSSGQILPSQSSSHRSLETTLEILLISEFISFAILYYLNWIQRINIYKDIYKAYHKNTQNGNKSRFSHPLNNPYILTALIVVSTVIFELAYPIPSTLVLFITIVPQISISLLFEDQLSYQSSINTKKIYIFANLWFLVVGIFYLQCYYTIVCGISLMLLIYLVFRVGKQCTYIEYMVGKAIILVVVLIIDGMNVSPHQNNQQTNLPSLLTCVVILTLSIMAVRSVNNKILREELYKYFFSDADINCAMLCLPIIIGLLTSDLSYLLCVGCLLLLGVSYKVGRDNQYVTMGS